MKSIIIASKNKNKKREIEALLKGMKVKVLAINETHKRIPIIVENGTTFRQNAIKKAIIVSKVLEGFAIADDSGVEVDSLHGRPGVRSARFARVKAADSENNMKLLYLLRNIPPRKRGATFVCSVAIADRGKLLGTVEGRCRGWIGFEPRGKNGFGYDPLFTPNGYNLTFAEMKPRHKNKISHRGEALRKAKAVIRKYL